MSAHRPHCLSKFEQPFKCVNRWFRIHNAKTTNTISIYYSFSTANFYLSVCVFSRWFIFFSLSGLFLSSIWFLFEPAVHHFLSRSNEKKNTVATILWVADKPIHHSTIKNSHYSIKSNLPIWNITLRFTSSPPQRTNGINCTVQSSDKLQSRLKRSNQNRNRMSIRL